MDALETLRSELTRLGTRQEAMSQAVESRLNDVVAALDAAQMRDADGDTLMASDEAAERSNSQNATSAIRGATKALQEGVGTDLKDVVASLSRFSKLVDSHGSAGLADVVAPSVVLPEDPLRRAVAEHLYHVAMFDVAREFCQEATVRVPPEHVKPFETLHHLLSSFRAGDLGPAVEWARENRAKLTQDSLGNESSRRALVSKLRQAQSNTPNQPTASEPLQQSSNVQPEDSDAAMIDSSPGADASTPDASAEASQSNVPSERSPASGGPAAAVLAGSTSSSESSASSSGSSGMAPANNGSRTGATTGQVVDSAPDPKSRRSGTPPATKSASTAKKPLRSRLEFSLARLEFLDTLQKGDRRAALHYARSALVLFVADYLVDVQQLMACLVYAPEISCSPYRHLVDSSHRAVVERLLCAEYCRIAGMPLESPLLSVVRCGAIAMPVLLKASRVSPSWRELGVDDALPVEIDIGRDCQHHSIFTCPVSREECSDNVNVPMILPCGHVLSRQSIHRLPRGNNPRFKCPYCPMEQQPGECKPVRF